MHSIKKFINRAIANHSILFSMAIIVSLVIIGTLCFHFVEKRGLFHSFYVTTITMSTVGYGDITPVTKAGKIISIIYGFMGAPLFIGLTGIILQSRFQKIIKHSIREYHKELKEIQNETKKLGADIKKEHELHQELIEGIEKSSPAAKKVRWKKLFKRK